MSDTLRKDYGPIKYRAVGDMALIRLFGKVIWRKCGSAWALGPIVFGRNGRK